MRIDSPSTTVFDLMADARNELQWNASVSRVELLTDEPVGEGSQFVVEDRRGEHEVAITLFDRPGRVEFALTGKGMDVVIEYTFTETDGTTTAVGSFDTGSHRDLEAHVGKLVAERQLLTAFFSILESSLPSRCDRWWLRPA